MKKYTLLAFIFILALSACGKTKKAVISGTLKGTKAKYVYFEEVNIDGYTLIDSAEIKADGSFKITKPAGKHGYYALRVGKTKSNGPMDSPPNIILLITDSSEVIEVQAAGPDFRIGYTVKGSEETELMLGLMQYIRESNMRLDSLNPQIAMQMGKNMLDIQAAKQKEANLRKKYAKEFIAQHRDKMVSIQALAMLNIEEEFGIADSLVKSLSATYPDDPYIFNLRSQLAYMAPFVVGAMAPDFTLNTPAGEPISLSSFRGKYVLIDFWASWCQPCRQISPELVKLYNTHKGPSFEILGVSLDAEKEAWTKAIAEDKLTWKHVSDLGYWNSAAAKIYRINSIPHSILVDPDGKIAAKNLSPQQLDVLLKSLL